MITIEFELETHNGDGTLKPRPTYWLGTIGVAGVDKKHTDEIYEQLDAEQVFNV